MVLMEKAKQLHAQGLAVIPTGDRKQALTAQWQTLVGDNRIEPNGNFNGHNVKGVGVVTGAEYDSKYLLAIDVDCYDKDISKEMCALICDMVGEPTPFRVGEPPKFLVPILCTENTTKLTSVKFQDSKIEVLGKGQQFVAYGYHAKAKSKRYQWYNGEFDLSTVPTLSLSDIRAIIAEFERKMLEAGYEVTSTVATNSDDPFAGLAKSDVSLQEAEAILDHIDPDIEYDAWFRIGAALHHEFDGSADAFDLFDNWSSKGQKYTNTADLDFKWSTFDQTDGSKVSFKTVCSYAKQAGADLSAISKSHKHDDFDALIIEQTKDAQANRFKSADSLLLGEPEQPKWLIRDILERDSLVMIYGPSGAGKSYLSILISAMLSSGQTFHNHKTTPSTVVYMCGEGYRGVLARLRALRIDQALTSLGNLYLTNRITDFSSADDIKATVKELQDANITPDLIIVDTLARASGGFDENATNDMNKFVKACDYFRKTFNGCSVMPIHHTGKASQGVARGSSVLRAAMDVEMSVEPTEGNGFILTSTKAKDGEPFKPMGFSFKRINFGIHDDDGIELYSHVITPNDDLLAATTSKQLTPSGKKVLKVFEDMWARDDDRTTAPGTFIQQFGLGAPTEGFWVSDLKEAIRSSYSHENPKTLTSLISRGMADCIEKEYLAVWDEIVVKL